MSRSHTPGGGIRLSGYAVILVFLAALLYRQASLGRPILSLPVTLVSLAGASHVLCGFAWPQMGIRTALHWSTWVLIAVAAITSIRLMVPI